MILYMEKYEKTNLEISEEIKRLRVRLLQLEQERSEREDSASRKKILIIDDEVDLCQLIKEYVEKRRPKYTVWMAHDGEMGVKAIKEINPDLLILDINMPKKSGIEVYKEISKNERRKPDFPVLVFTVRKELEDFFDAINADSFIPKPVKLNQVMQEIDRLISREEKTLIFLLDKEKHIQTAGLKSGLKSSGYKVVVVEGIGAFMSLAIEYKPHYIVMEFEQQDVLSGVEFIGKLKETEDVLRKNTWPIGHNPPIIVYSYGENDHKGEALAAGADIYIGKPKSYESILSAINEMESEKVKKARDEQFEKEMKQKLANLEKGPKSPPTSGDFEYFNEM